MTMPGSGAPHARRTGKVMRTLHLHPAAYNVEWYTYRRFNVHSGERRAALVYYLLRVHKFNEDRYRGERAFRTRPECTADGLVKVNTREKSLLVCHRAHIYVRIYGAPGHKRGVTSREREEKRERYFANSLCRKASAVNARRAVR